MTVRIYGSTELGEKFSEGARQLWLALVRVDWSQEDLRAKLGVAKGVVGRWLMGERRPDDDRRAQLHRLFGIAPKLWDEPSRRAFSVPKFAAA